MVTEIKANDRPNKVVVTVDIESSLSPTLELAIALAVASRSNLHGLFIEDMDLLRVANLPFAREVILASGRPRILDNQQLFRSLNARSRHFRQSLERYAQQSSLAWTYSTVRGNRRSMQLAESADAQFLIIGRPPDKYSQVVKRKRILLINDQNSRLNQALDVVLANIPEQPVELLLVTSAETPVGDSLQRLTGQLEAHPNSRLIQVEPDELIATVGQKGWSVDFVIASRRDAELLQEIMQRGNCPVILVC
jgi:hypothetical protein